MIIASFVRSLHFGTSEVLFKANMATPSLSLSFVVKSTDLDEDNFTLTNEKNPSRMAEIFDSAMS